MKIPLSWLREFVDVDVSAEELAHRLTMAGLEVGDVIITGGWENCFVGYVEKVEPHPNADRLVLCTVNTGDGVDQRVVCGAPNVAQGQKIAFARVGAMLIDGRSGKPVSLKAAKIRGVVSEGMVCSEKELGLGQDHDGILVLPKDASVGMPLDEYMGDQVLDLEPTPNRSDWLSVLGVAYETAALTGSAVHEPEIIYPEEGMPISSQVSVSIGAPDLCPRYTASLIKGIAVGPSPRWLQQRLEKCDVRPINNIVDVTNYVMLEYGQPLHAFDYETLLRRRINVRRAYTGESMVTLDGIPRLLSSQHLVIADDRDARALGGVIGGLDSGITEATTDVILESASFDPANNRRTAQDFHLRTEATTRFEKGLRPDLTVAALRRATQLIHQVAGGTVANGIVDEYPQRREEGGILLTSHRMKQVLGMEHSMDQAKQVLDSLGFRSQMEGTSALRVTAPYWRSDIAIEDDLVEEVARISGYDAIPTEMLSAPIPHHQGQYMRDFREQVRDLLVREGLQEVISYSAVGLDMLKKARSVDNDSSLLKVANPISRDYQYMRPTLRASLMTTLAFNTAHQAESVSIFEIGRVYLKRQNDLPREPETAAGLLYGHRPGEGWLISRDRYNFYDAKGVVEALLVRLGVVGVFQSAPDSFFHPGKTASVLVNGSPVGVVGEVHPLVQESFEIDGAAVAFFELDLSKLLEALPQDRQAVQPLARYPASTRDISILVEGTVQASKVQAVIESQPLVEQALLFDAYEGEEASSSRVSLGYRIHFRAPDRTLSSEEVNRTLTRVVRLLETQVGASLRGGETTQR